MWTESIFSVEFSNRKNDSKVVRLFCKAKFKILLNTNKTIVQNLVFGKNIHFSFNN